MVEYAQKGKQGIPSPQQLPILPDQTDLSTIFLQNAGKSGHPPWSLSVIRIGANDKTEGFRLKKAETVRNKTIVAIGRRISRKRARQTESDTLHGARRVKVSG